MGPGCFEDDIAIVTGAASGFREAAGPHSGFRVRIPDDRDPETLPTVSIPGMLIEVAP